MGKVDTFASWYRRKGGITKAFYDEIKKANEKIEELEKRIQALEP